jgi:4-hydroxy-tetrahydrodipicolinate synthase
MFKGVFTALITPFSNGKLDEAAFSEFVNWQIEEGINGLVPCGTTGESPTLDHDEHNKVVTLCVAATAGRIPVMAGAGSNSTAESLSMAQHAKSVGADALLIAAPYYNKPTPEGVYQHYKAINDAVDLPIFIYNIPGRSVINITDEQIARIAELENVVGLKDATGDLARISSLRQHVSDDFIQLSGEDGTTLAFNAQGGQGVISVTANIYPKKCVALQDAFFAGNWAEALKIHDELTPLHDAMFCETSPIPAKYAASLLRKCSDELRLPLVPPADGNKDKIKTALQNAGLI